METEAKNVILSSLRIREGRKQVSKARAAMEAQAQTPVAEAQAQAQGQTAFVQEIGQLVPVNVDAPVPEPAGAQARLLDWLADIFS